jgi:peptidoglycan/xylan/chitin deacetylase (PgdA/CDA1 family)
MANDSSRKPSRRKPTRREAARATTIADPHYSKLTRKSTAGSTRRSTASRAATRQRTSRNAEQSGARRRSESASGFESLSHGAQQRVYGSRGKAPRRRGGGNTAALLVGIAVIAAFIGGGFLFWTHRSVNVTLNGSTQAIRIGSNLDDLFEKAEVDTNPGNYVSVSGKVIEEGAGYAYTASVDGKQLSRKDTEAYRIAGGEEIEMTDGGDRMEPYDVEYRDVQPKLVFDGTMGSVSFISQWGKPGRQEIRTGKESGETADGDWVEELKDCVIVTKNLEPANDQKLVALTFDDGPASSYTEGYLQILEDKGVKATFFNLAENEDALPELAQKVAASGNQICSHTNHHLQLSTLSQEELVSEITSAHDTILASAGVDTTIIRPPYGDFNQNCWLLSQGTMSASILWNQDTVDWSQPGVDAIVQSALTDLQSGSIILMHDGGGPRDQDLEALPRIIDELKERGYTLVTVSELLDSDPEVPDEVAQGNATMPEGCVWPTEIGEAVVSVE